MMSSIWLLVHCNFGCHYLSLKEFVLYSGHEALKYLCGQHKLSSRHARQNTSLEEFSFILHHKLGVHNNMADALNRRQTLLTSIQIEVLGFENMKEVQQCDEHFGPIISSFEHDDQVPNYSFQEGYLFHGVYLCILHGSLRDLVMKEAHNSGNFWC